MTNAIKWTPGRPPEPRNEKDQYICCCTDGSERWITTLHVTGGIPVKIIAHALINYPLTVNEAVTYDDSTDSWTCWDINGTAFHTGLASREEAEAAYRDEYGEW